MTEPRRLPEDEPSGAAPKPAARLPLKAGDLANWGGVRVRVDGTAFLYGEPRYMITDDRNLSFVVRWEDLTPWQEIAIDPEAT